MEITQDLLEAYRTYVAAGSVGSEGCIPWYGPVSYPIRADSLPIAMFVYFERTMNAQRVAHAIKEGVSSIPFGGTRNSCGNYMCVNPDHIFAFTGGRTGRSKLPLEETAKYAERVELVTSVLRVNPNTKFQDLLTLLQHEKLGGNTAVISRIVQTVRAELGLPKRNPPGPRKVTLQKDTA